MWYGSRVCEVSDEDWRTRLEKRQALYRREVNDWTDAELLAELTASYGPVEVPPCRVCGAALGLASAGAGPTVWACSGREPDPADPKRLRWSADRAPADEHYSRSRWEDNRCGGDERVMDLVRRFSGASGASDQRAAPGTGCEAHRPEEAERDPLQAELDDMRDRDRLGSVIANALPATAVAACRNATSPLSAHDFRVLILRLLQHLYAAHGPSDYLPRA